MKSRSIVVALGLGALTWFTVPASGQMVGFPDYAVPFAAAPSTWLAATWGTGLNDDSGKANAYGAAIGRAGEKVSFTGGLGMVSDEGESDLTFGGAVGIQVLAAEAASVSVQGGVGYYSPIEDYSYLRFPVGVAIQGSIETGEASITPWAMPKLNIARASIADVSDTSTDFGASGGLSFNFAGGFGVHTALDIVFGENRKPVLFGLGGHYVLGGGGN